MHDLDQLAVAERTVFFRTTAAQDRYFNPSHAAYYTDSTDPPGTAAFRRALALRPGYGRARDYLERPAP